jgi:chaperonin GroES
MPDDKTKDILLQALVPDTKNVADYLDDDKLNTLGAEICELYQLDLNSRDDWQKRAERAMVLAKQTFEARTFPTGETSSSIKFPILTDAAIQFASRAYPELLKGSDIVKCEVTGRDDEMGTKEQRANRIQAHMSWQLTKQDRRWLPDMDFALHAHPIIGGFVKKTYFDPGRGRNISEVVSLGDYVVNMSADRHNLRRESHRYWVYKNDILEKMRSGLWKEYDDLGMGERESDQGDRDAGHEIIECHCFYDIDGDEYKEPWIVTVHRSTGKVLRVWARFEEQGIKKNQKGEIFRIESTSYFTLYPFFPDPAGGFYPIGWGHLVEPLNEGINTIINQLIDAGTLSVRAGGLIARGVKLVGREKDISPFRWNTVNIDPAVLRNAIFPFPVREPSMVLFQLLGLLIEAAKGITNLKDVLAGETTSLGKDLSPTTYMGMVEQGLKVFIGIYKRFYEALTEEFRKLYRLNAIYLEPAESFMVAGEQQQVALSDYREDDLEVLPVADPNLATDLLRRAQDQALLSMMQMPGVNPLEVVRRAVKHLHTGAEDKLLLTDGQLSGQEPVNYQPPPSPDAIIAQAEAKKIEQIGQAQQAKVLEAGLRFKMDVAEFGLRLRELESSIKNKDADTMLKMAKAESEGSAMALAEYQTAMAQVNSEIERQMTMGKEILERMEQMAGGNGSAPANPNAQAQAQGAPEQYDPAAADAASRRVFEELGAK